MPDRNSDVDDPERLEAAVRAAMYHHSRIAPRGWESIRQRETIHREIDADLDRWAESRLLQALARISEGTS